MDNPWVIDTVDLVIRLFLALLLGGLVGLERERSNHAAGLRTHILVCIGSTLIMLLSMYGFADFVGESNVRLDPARLAAQVISGIGFLGAGVILRNGIAITGLTTAASLWVVAAIGLAVGAGFYLAAATSTALVLFSLLILNKVEQKWLQGKKTQLIKIKAVDRPGSLGDISNVLQSHNMEIRKVSLEQADQDNVSEQEQSIYLVFNVKLSKPSQLVAIMEVIRGLKGVTEVIVE